MSPEFIFHIGLEKTGTDSFQRFCAENHRSLRAQGILYPTRSLAFAGRSHGPLVACYLPYRDLSVGPDRGRARVLRSLRAEIERISPRTVLISAEHFSSRLRAPQIEQLAADFAGSECRIAVVVREHTARIRSAYAQTILAGRTPSFDEYCAEIFHPDNPYVRTRDTLEPWLRVFGRENLRVFSLASGTDTVAMLLEGLMPQVGAIRTDASCRENESPGATAIEALRQVSLQLPASDSRAGERAGRIRWLLLRLARRHLGAQIAAAAAGHRRGHYRLSEPYRARLEEIAGADRRWLEGNFGIRLDPPDADSEPLPDEALARSLAAQALARPWVKLLTAMR